ncbi:F-BAR domain only protein 2 isoform X2 [Alosa alosa]|uniref:F-BAR domain only protein 2 isoform X2 n=1 Tax=Alosa alosa TaxID=278164 RepID=UPI0020152906|nr:F-BAR domain only protein 2 isoform X2 [Alosa alosa]
MITPYFLENFWGEKNNGFDVLYHNMKNGQISSKELTDYIRERSTIEEAYGRSMTKLAKSASNFSQLGTFAPVWELFKSSTEKLAGCHLELVRKLQELMKEVQKYVDDQAKAHKKTKEEVASTLEAVQNIQTISQALQKAKENYNSKVLDQERLRKEGATTRDVEKAGVKAKKATEAYKSYVEKYATAKTEFEQRMAETAQKFQGIEENHILHMKEIIQSYSRSVEETHVQIGEVQKEFVNNIENTSVESLIKKLAESKGTGVERPGSIEFEECNVAVATEGIKPRKRKGFGIPGRRKDKDTDSTESTEGETNTANGAPPGYYGAIDVQNANAPQVDEEGFCIRPEQNDNDAKENSFYSSSDSEDEDEPRKFKVEIKPVQPNNTNDQHRATLDQLKASINNITLSPSTSVQMRRNQSSDELGRPRGNFNENKLANNDLLSLDPFGPSQTAGSASSVSAAAAEAVHQQESSLQSPLGEPMLPKPGAALPPPSPFSLSSPPHTPMSLWDVPDDPLRSSSVPLPDRPPPSPPSAQDPLAALSWSQSQWVAFSDDLAPRRRGVLPSAAALCRQPLPQQLLRRPQSVPPAPQAAFARFAPPGATPLQPVLLRQETATLRSEDSPAPMDISAVAALASLNNDVPPPNRPTTPLNAGALAPPPPRPSSRPKLPAAKLAGITELSRPFSPPKVTNSSPPPTAPLARAESSSSLSSNASFSASNTPTVEDDVFIGKLPTFEKRCETPAGTSRGPSPVTLASQDPLPIAVAFTESVNAYFKGADPSKCIVKITGDVTLSFPSGIIKVFTSAPSPAVLSFRLRNTSRLEQILPNQQLLHSDASQSDPDTKDFWMNMQALTAYLRKTAEQNPSASYYNVDILKYQVNANGIQSTPLNLAVYWKCTPVTTDLRVDYRYNPEAMGHPGTLGNVQVLVPVDGGVTNMQSLPAAIWNAEQNKSLWKLGDISEKSEDEGSGSLRAKFELSDGPSTPATLAVQFFSEGSTLSGADLELLGAGYRLSLNKKRFATGRYMADC